MVAHRLLGQASPFAPYINNLPMGVAGLPMFFNGEALGELQYPPVTEQVLTVCGHHASYLMRSADSCVQQAQDVRAFCCPDWRARRIRQCAQALNLHPAAFLLQVKKRCRWLLSFTQQVRQFLAHAERVLRPPPKLPPGACPATVDLLAALVRQACARSRVRQASSSPAGENGMQRAARPGAGGGRWAPGRRSAAAFVPGAVPVCSEGLNLGYSLRNRLQVLGPLRGTDKDPFEGAEVDANALGWALAVVTSRAFRTRGPNQVRPPPSPACCYYLFFSGSAHACIFNATAGWRGSRSAVETAPAGAAPGCSLPPCRSEACARKAAVQGACHASARVNIVFSCVWRHAEAPHKGGLPSRLLLLPCGNFCRLSLLPRQRSPPPCCHLWT